MSGIIVALISVLILLAGAILVLSIQALVDALFGASIYGIYLKIREITQNKRKPKTSAMELLKTSQETFVNTQVRVNCQLKPGKVFPIKIEFLRDKNNKWIALNGKGCFGACSDKCSRCQGALSAMLTHDIRLLEKEPITLYDLDSSTGYSDYIDNKLKIALAKEKARQAKDNF